MILWVPLNFSPLGLSFLVESENTELKLGLANSNASQNQEGNLNMYKANQIRDYKAEVGSWRAHVPFRDIKSKFKK